MMMASPSPEAQYPHADVTPLPGAEIPSITSAETMIDGWDCG
jgi:hypothetical protein